MNVAICRMTALYESQYIYVHVNIEREPYRPVSLNAKSQSLLYRSSNSWLL